MPGRAIERAETSMQRSRRSSASIRSQPHTSEALQHGGEAAATAVHRKMGTVCSYQKGGRVEHSCWLTACLRAHSA
eukprot:6174509-Pleurochrysis_carterae.AAC.3